VTTIRSARKAVKVVEAMTIAVLITLTVQAAQNGYVPVLSLNAPAQLRVEQGMIAAAAAMQAAATFRKDSVLIEFCVLVP